MRGIFILIFVCAVSGAAYHYMFGTSKVYERTTVTLLTDVQNIMGLDDPSRVESGINARIAGNAGIHLEIHYTPKGQQKEVVMPYDLNRDQFMGYIGKLLHFTKNYSFVPEVTDVSYRDETKSEVVEFNSRIEADRRGEWGNGQVAEHYVLDAECGANIMNATESKDINVLTGASNPTMMGSFNCRVRLQDPAAASPAR